MIKIASSKSITAFKKMHCHLSYPCHCSCSRTVTELSLALTGTSCEGHWKKIKGWDEKLFSSLHSGLCSVVPAAETHSSCWLRGRCSSICSAQCCHLLAALLNTHYCLHGRFARIKSISFLYLSVGFPRLINVCVPSPSLWLLAPAAALTVFHGKLQIWLCQLETLTVP